MSMKREKPKKTNKQMSKDKKIEPNVFFPSYLHSHTDANTFTHPHTYRDIHRHSQIISRSFVFTQILTKRQRERKPNPKAVLIAENQAERERERKSMKTNQTW